MTVSASTANLPQREWWPALRLGFRCRCPACGEGKIFKAYLKVDDCCSACGEELHHHQADDAPPYFTIFIVAHIIGAMMLWVEHYNDALDIWIHMAVWPLLTLAMTLWFLPRIKGALVGYQWALRMHGFETAPTSRIGKAA